MGLNVEFCCLACTCGVLAGAIGCQIAVKSLRPEMGSSLETGAVLDGALSRHHRTDWGCMSVMRVREKCDEKCWEERSGVGLRPSKCARSGTPDMPC